jgi:hypothetical protein
MDHNDLYQKLSLDKDLTTGFLILFSRFEYALKQTGRYAAGDENEVKAYWNKFAQDHVSQFDSEKSPELKAAIKYLKDKPPKKQTLKNGSLYWKDVPTQNTPLLVQVLDAVRRVRNNLFHGGKFRNSPMEDPGRDSELLSSCITVLEECLSLNDAVYRQFYNNKP